MTICALATAPGGALGIIRISGPKTLEILSRVFTKNLTEADGNTIHYGHIKDGEVVVDEVLVSVFRAPHSYTGEESAEISCHGSRYILNKVLALLIGMPSGWTWRIHPASLSQRQDGSFASRGCSRSHSLIK